MCISVHMCSLMCMCVKVSVCVHTCALCVYGCVCMCMRESECVCVEGIVDTECLPQLLTSIFTEAGSVTELGAHQLC